MPFDPTTLDNHLKRVTGELPVTFTWNAVNYQGTVSTPTFSETLMIGGFDYDIVWHLYIRAALLPSIPAIGQAFTIATLIYKVLRVRPSPDSSQLLNFALGYARAN